jgi:hypothetical protein
MACLYGLNAEAVVVSKLRVYQSDKCGKCRRNSKRKKSASSLDFHGLLFFCPQKSQIFYLWSRTFEMLCWQVVWLELVEV